MKISRTLRETVKTLVIAVIVAIILRVSIVEAFQIPTSSMENTLLPGDFILGNKFIYGLKFPFINYRIKGLRDPQVGDIVIFKFPKDESINYIKRCVAINGQIVEIRNKELFVDNKKVLDSPLVKYVDDRIYPPNWLQGEIYPPGKGNRDNFGPVKVEEGNIFVMGDNRDNSFDSRFWGQVPLDNVIGKAMFVYWSWNKKDSNSNKEFFDFVRWHRIGEIIK